MKNSSVQLPTDSSTSARINITDRVAECSHYRRLAAQSRDDSAVGAGNVQRHDRANTGSSQGREHSLDRVFAYPHVRVENQHRGARTNSGTRLVHSGAKAEIAVRSNQDDVF